MIASAPAQKTVFCTLDSADPTRYVELLTIDGITINTDNGFLSPTSTNYVINGASYLPYRCSVEINQVGESVTVVTTVLVTTRGT